MPHTATNGFKWLTGNDLSYLVIESNIATMEPEEKLFTSTNFANIVFSGTADNYNIYKISTLKNFTVHYSSSTGIISLVISKIPLNKEVEKSNSISDHFSLWNKTLQKIVGDIEDLLRINDPSIKFNNTNIYFESGMRVQ